MILYAKGVGLALIVLGLPFAAAAQDAISVTTRGRFIQPGELVVLTLRTRMPAESVTVHAFGRDHTPYQVGASSTWRVLIGIDLVVEPGTHEVIARAEPGGREAIYDLVVRSRAFRTRTLKVDPAFVTPPPETLERIERESRELEAIWEASSPAKLWKGPFVRPVPHRANSAFGTHSVFNGEPRSQHAGADFRSPTGTPIKAPNAGRVVLATSRYFSGNTVVIDHGLGLFSFFAHLSAIRVETGELVKTGRVLGRVGATGRVTGPHLHWAVRVNGARIDPLSILALREF